MPPVCKSPGPLLNCFHVKDVIVELFENGQHKDILRVRKDQLVKQTSVLETQTRVLRNGHNCTSLNISRILDQLLESVQQDSSSFDLESNRHGFVIVEERAQVAYLDAQGFCSGIEATVVGSTAAPRATSRNGCALTCLIISFRYLAKSALRSTPQGSKVERICVAGFASTNLQAEQGYQDLSVSAKHGTLWAADLRPHEHPAHHGTLGIGSEICSLRCVDKHGLRRQGKSNKSGLVYHGHAFSAFVWDFGLSSPTSYDSPVCTASFGTMLTMDLAVEPEEYLV
ncbi:hypothetical protein KCV07_g42, partial [Aureobasidium melanogenum]